MSSCHPAQQSCGAANSFFLDPRCSADRVCCRTCQPVSCATLRLAFWRLTPSQPTMCRLLRSWVPKSSPRSASCYRIAFLLWNCLLHGVALAATAFFCQLPFSTVVQVEFQRVHCPAFLLDAQQALDSAQANKPAAMNVCGYERSGEFFFLGPQLALSFPHLFCRVCSRSAFLQARRVGAGGNRSCSFVSTASTHYLIASQSGTGRLAYYGEYISEVIAKQVTVRVVSGTIRVENPVVEPYHERCLTHACVSTCFEDCPPVGQMYGKRCGETLHLLDYRLILVS